MGPDWFGGRIFRCRQNVTDKAHPRTRRREQRLFCQRQIRSARTIQPVRCHPASFLGVGSTNTDRSRRDIEHWKQRILSALGVNAQVIVEVIPELELIIGKQPPVPELKPLESQNRFNLYFQRFIAALARPEQPLVLFLDDLQWASVASIRLFQSWVSGMQVDGLLIIGAYRDNEVDATHPLRSVLVEIRESGATMREINLEPLDIESVNHIIRDTLGRSAKASQPLADCVHRKTGGNPFFARAFLRSLYEEGNCVSTTKHDGVGT